MDKFMSPLLQQIIINNLESRTLASLRDSLLPKLMRGEVRVSAL
jgi:type I restriction enzyme S subunit